MPSLTGNSRRREQRLQELMINRLSLRFERQLSREIGRAMRAGARGVEAGRIEPWAAVRAEHERRITLIMQSLWANSSGDMVEHIFGTQRSWRGKIEAKGLDVTPTEIIDSIMRLWLAEHGGLKIKQITNTTLKDIRQIIEAGIASGASEREIARAIEAVAPTKSASRAQTIARTETHASSAYAAQASAGATGLTMRKVWVSARGERTREDHDEADGQTRLLHEPFDIGGEALMYPGDPVGSAAQVINCRCVCAYEFD